MRVTRRASVKGVVMGSGFSGCRVGGFLGTKCSLKDLKLELPCTGSLLDTILHFCSNKTLIRIYNDHF